jgi:hypothetical protein
MTWRAASSVRSLRCRHVSSFLTSFVWFQRLKRVSAQVNKVTGLYAPQSQIDSREGFSPWKSDWTRPVRVDLTRPASGQLALSALAPRHQHRLMNNECAASGLQRQSALNKWPNVQVRCSPTSGRAACSLPLWATPTDIDRTLTLASGHCVTTDQRPVGVSQRETLPRLCYLLKPYSNVLATKCNTLCTCVSIFSQSFSRVMLAHRVPKCNAHMNSPSGT